MLLKRLRPVIAGFFLALSVGNLHPQNALKVECYESMPRYYLDEDGKVRGLGVDLIQYVNSKSQYKLVYPETVIPLARVESHLSDGYINAIFGLGKTDVRQKNMIVGESLFDQNLMAVVRLDDKVDFKTLKDLVALGDQGIVLAVRVSSMTEQLKKIPGLKVDDGAYSYEQTLRKLLASRGRIAIYNDINAGFIVKNSEFSGKVKILSLDLSQEPQALQALPQHVMFSKTTDRAAIDEINRVIATGKKNGDIKKILDKYRF
ncbi:substrate-binding periplasmic protein [Rhodoferax saidenbachensis]|uniref:Solute-binding protein family 3/N-terminal domain-containing protein n=1 Tax=Rhodoferax saidenbachensis TaxID=1484693 RepID=A0A1P8K5C8_9BURK|nr:transporter substrate-binding domain-containing protein [Rhodoferax saidenbachensis]APW41224.1 hypothetical protein RS694_00800 [Rhodoferax saidenbachensis]